MGQKDGRVMRREVRNLLTDLNTDTEVPKLAAARDTELMARRIDRVRDVGGEIVQPMMRYCGPLVWCQGGWSKLRERMNDQASRGIPRGRQEA